MSVSKQARQRRGPKVEFGMLGMMIGAGAGLLVGFVWELVSGPKVVTSQVAGVAGLAIGAAVEGVRYGWRRWRQKKREQSKR